MFIQNNDKREEENGTFFFSAKHLYTYDIIHRKHTSRLNRSVPFYKVFYVMLTAIIVNFFLK